MKDYYETATHMHTLHRLTPSEEEDCCIGKIQWNLSNEDTYGSGHIGPVSGGVLITRHSDLNSVGTDQRCLH